MIYLFTLTSIHALWNRYWRFITIFRLMQCYLLSFSLFLMLVLIFVFIVFQLKGRNHLESVRRDGSSGKSAKSYYLTTGWLKAIGFQTEWPAVFLHFSLLAILTSAYGRTLDSNKWCCKHHFQESHIWVLRTCWTSQYIKWTCLVESMMNEICLLGNEFLKWVSSAKLIQLREKCMNRVIYGMLKVLIYEYSLKVTDDAMISYIVNFIAIW